MKKILFALAIFTSMISLIACSKTNKKQEFTDIETIQKKHSWFYFTDTGFEQIDLPQNAPEKTEKPWTESVRISSAASLPYAESSSRYNSFALVNRLGVLAFNGSQQELYTDNSIFSQDTADSLVFSSGKPVFYLYQSSFFNTKIYDEEKQLQDSRPFLVEFDSSSKIFFPLVSYKNLGLSDSDQITGFFWDGKKWTCSAKKATGEGVEFSYFEWEPFVDLTDLSPAIGQNYFSFKNISEDQYKRINMPQLFNQAPEELKKLFKFIPEEFTFFVSWRNTSGNSAVSYFQQGTSNIPLNAHAAIIPVSGYTAAVFADGTTYIKKISENEIKAFRLPLLPAGFCYGEFALSGKNLYVAWEEASFYKTGRAGFICVDLEGLI